MPSHRRRSGSSDRATILSLLLGIPLWIVIAYVIIEAGLPKGYGIIVGLVIPLAAVVVVYMSAADLITTAMEGFQTTPTCLAGEKGSEHRRLGCERIREIGGGDTVRSTTRFRSRQGRSTTADSPVFADRVGTLEA